MSRHFSNSPYCVACRQRVVVCVCSAAPRLELATRLVLLMHAAEWGRSSNTGHLLRLAVRDPDIRIHGRPNRLVEETTRPAGSVLALFPRSGAQVLTPEFAESLPRPITLLVPDGNWNQSLNMMRRLPMLLAARPVRLEGESLGLGPLRHNGDPVRRSTFEAIARTIGVLEGEDAERRMLAFFRYVLERRVGNGRVATIGSPR